MLQKIKAKIKNPLFIKKIILIICTISGTLSFGYMANLSTGNKVFTQSILGAIFAAALAFFLFQTVALIEKLPNQALVKRRIWYAFFTSLLLSLSLVLGYQIRMQGITSSGIKGKLFILVIAIGLSFVVFPVMNLFYHWLDSPKKVSLQPFKIPPLITWGIIFVAWIPVFLAYYPAIMSYDFNVQSIQVFTESYHTHHPLIHTGLLWIFFSLGELLGSYTLGMAFFSIFQMLIMSLIFSYACHMVLRLSGRNLWYILSILFYSVLPIHSILAVSITKDVLFCGFFLLFLLLLLERSFFPKATLKGKLLLDTVLILSGAMMILFRNNAVYAFIPFALLYFLMVKKEKLRILLLSILILILGLGTNFGLKNVLKADSGTIAEMCSVPMQQMARTGMYHALELSEEDYAMIDWYVDDEYWNRYNPPIADTVKIMVSAYQIENWEKDIFQTLKDWLTIGLHYPNDYLDAFLCLTSGYWFLDDVSYAEVLGCDLESRMGLLYTFNASASSAFEGVPSNSLLPGLEGALENIVSANSFFKWPVLSQLFKPAFYVWILFMGIFAFFYQKEKGRFLYLALPLLYLFTLMLGPVALVRYAFVFIAFTPVVIGLIRKAQ